MYRMPYIASLLVILIASGLAPLPNGVGRVAQEATPAVALPGTPAPAHCTVGPRAVDPLLARLGTPSATSSQVEDAQNGEDSVVSVPVGRPASKEVEAEITATVYELHACFNAGDVRRAFALVTDDFLQTFAAGQSLTAEDIAFFTVEPVPAPPEARTALLAITDVSVLASGQVGAFVITVDPFTGPDTEYMTFVQRDERWLIDGAMEFIGE